MSPPIWASLIAVAAGGAIGAVCRYSVGLIMLRWHPEAGPLGTLAVNLVGCFLIGLLMPLAERPNLQPIAALLVITGGLGALTTFSTFGHETVLLIERQRVGLAFLNVMINLVVGVALVWAGRSLVRWLSMG